MQVLEHLSREEEKTHKILLVKSNVNHKIIPNDFADFVVDDVVLCVVVSSVVVSSVVVSIFVVSSVVFLCCNGF